MAAVTCSLFFHNYYGEHESWAEYFSKKLHTPFNLCYNIVENSVYNLDYDRRKIQDLIRSASGPWLKNLIVRWSPNGGKDIGGKLVLLDAFMREELQSDYFVFLHDKKSPHKAEGQEWQKKLFRILEPSFITETLAMFEKQPGIGIIARAGSIRDEYDSRTGSFSSQNKDILEQLSLNFNLHNGDHHYVAGTMFWARSRPVLDFFCQYSPLTIRKSLEGGNVLDEEKGSVTHSWERMLSWLIFAQGYTIKGI